MLCADLKFTIDRFAEMVEGCCEVKDVRGDEFYSIELSLGGGVFFCLDLDPEGTPLMFFLFRLQSIKTEVEIQAINEALDSKFEGSIGKVVQVRDCEFVYFSVVERDGLCADSLMVVLAEMNVGRKNIMTYFDNATL